MGDRGVDGRIILKQILQKCGVRVRAESSWVKIGFGGGLC
jgi:hypothetical protein